MSKLLISNIRGSHVSKLIFYAWRVLSVSFSHGKSLQSAYIHPNSSNLLPRSALNYSFLVHVMFMQITKCHLLISCQYSLVPTGH